MEVKIVMRIEIIHIVKSPLSTLRAFECSQAFSLSFSFLVEKVPHGILPFRLL